jgi:hypothetical protein
LKGWVSFFRSKQAIYGNLQGFNRLEESRSSKAALQSLSNSCMPENTSINASIKRKKHMAVLDDMSGLLLMKELI